MGSAPEKNHLPIGTLFLLIMFGALVVRAGTVLGLDTDCVLHLAYGRAILAARSPWLPEDPTIYTGLGPPLLHEWLAEALFAALDRLFGAWGLVRLAALVGALVPWVVYRRALRATGSLWPSMLAWMAAAAGIATGLLVRPHLFSMVAFLVVYRLLDRWRATGALRPVAPGLALTIVLWTNLHGGGAVTLLPLLLGLFGACNWRTPGARLLPLGYALTLVNPWGPGLHRHVWAFLRSAAPGVAADMGPPDAHSGTLWVLLGLVLLLTLAAYRRFRPVQPTALAVTAATFLASLVSMRNLPFLGIALAHLLPEILDAWLKGSPQIDQRSRVLVQSEPTRPVAPWALAALSLLPTGPLPQPRPSGPGVPTAAIAWLGEHPEVGRRHGYADYGDAGFLLHAGVVERLYLHALNANTPLGLAGDHLVFREGAPAWQGLFARHQVSWALTHTDQPLTARLAAAGWRTVWRGGDRVVQVQP
jgi:hypothetical protein